MRQKLSEYFETLFHRKIQKIPVNAHLTCPNRDGKSGNGGCIYCCNKAFNPKYAYNAGEDIKTQIESGIKFFKRKEDCSYLIYFQSYSNTYGESQKLISLYEQALAYPNVVGLVIATRGDCLKDDMIDYFEKRFGRSAPSSHPYLLVEIGVESTKDDTLARINRGHDYQCCKDAINRLESIGIDVGAHIILGLPGENEDDFILHAKRLSLLPIKTLKLHQLQIIKGTTLAQMYEQNPTSIHVFSLEEYLRVVADFLSNLRQDIIIDRYVCEVPKSMLLAPFWGLKPAEIEKMINKV